MPTSAWDAIDPEHLPPSQLHAAYVEVLRKHLTRIGEGDLPSEPGTTDGIEALREGADHAVRLSDAAAVLSLASRLEPREVEYELLDRLLIAMTNAVIDVETLADEVDLELSPKELQQRIEGRAPMTLAEFAHVRHVLARRVSA